MEWRLSAVDSRPQLRTPPTGMHCSDTSLAFSVQTSMWLIFFRRVYLGLGGSYPRSLDRGTVMRPGSVTEFHTRLCRVPYVCLVYRLRSVMVILDCVVYHMVVWCTVYDGAFRDCMVYHIRCML